MYLKKKLKHVEHVEYFYALYVVQVLSLVHVNTHTHIVADRKRSGISGPIRSVKMYSYAQCTMQKRSVCCRDVPCLDHMDEGPGPLHPEHPLPSLSAWVLGTQSTSSSQQGWTWTVEWTLASSPTQNLWSWKMYIDIALYFPSSNTVFWNAYQMIICLVLIVVIFLGLITHNME
jgi:hypothetical protein